MPCQANDFITEALGIRIVAMASPASPRSRVKRGGQGLPTGDERWLCVAIDVEQE